MTTSVAHIIRRRRAKRARRHQERARARGWALFIALLMALGLVLPAGALFGGAAYLYLRAVAALPTPAETTYLDPIIGQTQFFTRDGQTPFFTLQDPLGNNRVWIELDDLPPYVAEATLLIEDPDFLRVSGFDASATLSRLWTYMFSAPPASDTSLTGRLVRNAVLPLARASGLDDSVLEISLTAEINRLYSPREILEWHLNTNYYGNNAYGIEAAAQVYLGKPARELSLDEAALLAAIPTAPQFNPFDNETAARGRQADLLRNLFIGQYIDQASYETAVSRLTPVRPRLAQEPPFAAEFAVYASDQARKILDALGYDGARMLARGGLNITTTLDLDLYDQIECLARGHLARLAGQDGAVTARDGRPCVALDYLPPTTINALGVAPNRATVVLINVRTGEILAMFGAADEHAYPPGPTLQPFVYFEGFRSLFYNLGSMVLDIPQPFPGPADGLIYTPANPDGMFRGPLNLRDAMAAWLLPPAVQVADSRGMSAVISSAHLIGLNSLDQTLYDLSLLEHGGDVSVLDMTYAYSVFASLGIQQGVSVRPIASGFRSRDPLAILQISDAQGNVLWSYDETQIALSKTVIFDSSLGYLITDALADAETRAAILGAESQRALDILRPAAIVSGITSGKTDSWTLGYTPSYVVGVHVGRADRLSFTSDPHGLGVSAPMWRAVMAYIHDREALAPETWPQPDDLGGFIICEKSGMVPRGSDSCPTRNEILPRGVQLPLDSYWRKVEVNSQTRQLATANTPANLRTELLYFVPPPEAMDWWRSNNQPLPPQEYDSISRPEVLQAVQILRPSYFEYVGGVVDIRGTIETGDFAYYQIAYGAGVDPDQWFEIGGQQTTFTPGVSLGQWDTNGLDGVYTLWLKVVYDDNSVDSAFVQVSVDNRPPTITLSAGLPGQVFRWPDDRTIPLVAEVADNLAIDRVEFFHNGLTLGVDTEWPYGFEFSINRVGTELFSAVAYDAVGNSARSDLQVDIGRGS